MLVSHQSDHITHAVIGGKKSINFGISDDPAFFQILSSALYKDPMLAMVRETICNAWDAHIESGNIDKPIEVTLDDDYLIIKDFGHGIPDALIGPIYGVYGASTKKNDGRQTGGFGLGCKSPFAYTDHFEVTSCHAGMKTIYNMSKSSAAVQGKPSIVPIASFPTTESGIMVKIPLDPSKNNNRIKSLVDPDRRNECSNGLHVARRGYVRGFTGNVIVLAKVRPEDVIAVPDYDANKMRVCGYHIIAELSQAQYQAINNNRPISDAEGGAELLGRAIAGDHVGVLEHVKITKQQGEGLEIVPAKETKRTKAKAKKKAVKKGKAKPVKAVKPLEAAVASSDKPVNVKKVAAKVTDQSVSLSEEELPQLTQTDVVKAMWDKALAGNKGQAQKLLAFKKKAKKGWMVWGLPSTAGDTLKALLDP